jgi:phospholipid transport system substrate-binding protein
MMHAMMMKSLAHRVTLSAMAALLALGIAASADAAAANSGAAEPVRGFYDVLLRTMKQGERLGQDERYAALEPVVRRSFDIPYMTRMAVGPSWPSLPEAKRQELTEAFGRYITATWAGRFDSYSGEKLEVDGERPYGAAMLVDTRIVKPDGEPVTINYLMRRDGDAWRIGDVYLTGTISELATRRSEFISVLRSQGIDGLIDALNRKAPIAARS